MNTASSPPRCPVIFGEPNLVVPSWVTDLNSYREWAWSPEFPEGRKLAYLAGSIWVDLGIGPNTISTESLHRNLVKTALVAKIWTVADAQNLGCVHGEGMLLLMDDQECASCPAGIFYKWTSIRSGQIERITRNGHCRELRGVPDLVVEIACDKWSARRSARLRRAYCRAGVAELWNIDLRGETPRFHIGRLQSGRYLFSKQAWQPSSILGCELRLSKSVDPAGSDAFVVESR